MERLYESLYFWYPLFFLKERHNHNRLTYGWYSWCRLSQFYRDYLRQFQKVDRLVEEV